MQAIFNDVDVKEIKASSDRYGITDFSAYNQRLDLLAGYFDYLITLRPNGLFFTNMKEIGNTEDTVFNNIMEQFADSFEQTKVFSLLDAIAYLAHDFKKQEANIRRIFTVYEEVQSDILYDPNVNSYRIWIDGELQKHDNKVPVGFEEKAQYHQLDVSSRMDLIDVVDLLFTQWALGGKDFSDAFDQNLPIEQRFIRIIDMTKTPDERFNEVVKYTGVGDLYQYFINVNNTLGCNTTKTKIDFLVFDSLTWKDEPFFSYAKKQ